MRREPLPRPAGQQRLLHVGSLLRDRDALALANPAATPVPIPVPAAIAVAIAVAIPAATSLGRTRSPGLSRHPLGVRVRRPRGRLL